MEEVEIRLGVWTLLEFEGKILGDTCIPSTQEEGNDVNKAKAADEGGQPGWQLRVPYRVICFCHGNSGVDSACCPYYR